jgi:prepilin-type processing-associated H-X9-DG protein
LLVVIAIIGILAALLLPVLSRAKRRAQVIACASNQKQIGIALHVWVGDNADWLPPGEGKETGLWMGQSAAFNNTRSTVLVYYLAVNLGEHVPDETMRMAKVFWCPANIYHNDMLTNGVMTKTVYGVTTEGNLGLPWNPFGYPAVPANWNPGEPPHRMSELNSIRSLSDLWMLVDVDQAAPGFPGWRNTTPRTPAHGQSRNYLFFDSHVAGYRVMGDKSYSAPFAP